MLILWAGSIDGKFAIMGIFKKGRHMYRKILWFAVDFFFVSFPMRLLAAEPNNSKILHSYVFQKGTSIRRFEDESKVTTCTGIALQVDGFKFIVLKAGENYICDQVNLQNGKIEIKNFACYRLNGKSWEMVKSFGGKTWPTCEPLGGMGTINEFDKVMRFAIKHSSWVAVHPDLN
jgi:hypothetical protein